MEVLFVSKPVGPPWNDSSKNLVRDIAGGLQRHHAVVMGRKGSDFALERGRVDEIYPAAGGGFAPGIWSNARVMARLMTGRSADLWHFFFAPNPKSSSMGRIASRARKMKTLHTVCSAPREGADLDRLLFADLTVVLSRHTEERLIREGIPADRLTRVPPGIRPLAPLSPAESQAVRLRLGLPTDAPVILYPGDLEFGSGAKWAIDCLGEVNPDAVLAIACRMKTPAAVQADADLRAEVKRRGLESRVHWFGETPSIHALLGASDVVLLPADTLYAKMDYPLVLLEAMSMERPVVVAQRTAAAELGEHGALVVEPSAQAVANAVAKVIEDRDYARALGQQCRQAVLDRFSGAAMAAAYEELYDKLG